MQLCMFMEAKKEGGQVEVGSIYRVTHMNIEIIHKDWALKGKVMSDIQIV